MILTIILVYFNMKIIDLLNKVLRLIRFLKALRLITRVKGIKFLIECIIYSFDGIINVSILIFFLM